MVGLILCNFDSLDSLECPLVYDLAKRIFRLLQGRPSPVITCSQDPELIESNPYMHVIGEALMAEYPIPMTPIHSQHFAEIRSAVTPIMQG